MRMPMPICAPNRASFRLFIIIGMSSSIGQLSQQYRQPVQGTLFFIPSPMSNSSAFSAAESGCTAAKVSTFCCI